MIRTVSPQNAQLHLDELLEAVRDDNDTIVVESDGQIVAAVIGGDEYEKYLEYRLKNAWKTVERVQDRNADLEPDEVLADLALVVEQVRQERYEQECQPSQSDH